MTANPIRVVCVDDNVLVSDGLRRLMDHAADVLLVASVPTADDLPAVVARSRADVVLLDLELPGRDPFDAIRELCEHLPSARVLVLSGHVDVALVDRAVEAGAWAYISKSDPPQMVLNAVRGLSEGTFMMSPEVEDLYRRGVGQAP
jgi:two-component system, NarL family, invasion response regulator UvrY